VEVPLDTAPLAEDRDVASVLAIAVASAILHLKCGRNVIVHSVCGDADPRLAATAAVLARRGMPQGEAQTFAAHLIGSALGRVVRDILTQVNLRRVLLAGGDTSSYAARALGIEAVELIVPLAPGVPLCRAHAPLSPADGLEMNFKGGQAGAENYFATVARGQPWQ
jgi:uncharacterized protein YgbK (DUF1537 family)